MLLEDFADDNPVRADLHEICQAGRRAAELTRQLLAFSHQQVLEPQLVDIGAVVANMERMCRRILGEDVELVSLRGPKLGGCSPVRRSCAAMLTAAQSNGDRRRAPASPRRREKLGFAPRGMSSSSQTPSAKARPSGSGSRKAKTFKLTLDGNLRGYQLLVLPESVTTDAIRITVTATAEGTRWKNVAISEVRALH